ncbi:cache domain-containing protein, partial [Geminicoccus harenae]
MKGNVHPTRRHYRIGLGPLLTGGSVLFVSAVTVILVLFALVSAREAAIEPLRQGTRLFVDALAARIQDHLQTAQNQGDFISGMVARDLAEGAGAAQLTGTLTASLAAAPQVASIVYLRPDLTGLEVSREPSGPARVQILDLSGNVDAHRHAREVRAQEGGSWGRPFTLAGNPGLAVLNYRVPLRDPHGGAEPGMIVVTLRSDRLSRFMRELSAPPVRAAFILYGSDRVLAYPGFDGSMGSMPKLAEMRDPALRALVRPSPDESFFGERVDGTLTLRQVDGRQLLYLLRDLPGFAPETLWVGAYVDLNDVGVGPDRFYMIAMVGLSIVVAAAVMAALLARRLTSSIRNLA